MLDWSAVLAEPVLGCSAPPGPAAWSPQRIMRAPPDHCAAVGLRALAVYLPFGSSLPAMYVDTTGPQLSWAIFCHRVPSGNEAPEGYLAVRSTEPAISNRC